MGRAGRDLERVIIFDRGDKASPRRMIDSKYDGYRGSGKCNRRREHVQLILVTDCPRRFSVAYPLPVRSWHNPSD
jgi:hypothetical protein